MNRRDEANRTIQEINACINLLCNAPCDETKNNILNYLKCKVYDLYLINNLDNPTPSAAALIAKELPISNSRQFTKEELTAFDGKNGTPAYVAVNGTVYDVTNSAAWGAATHFGLSAGNDVTAQFNSCHAGQPILEKLPVVGKMI